MPKGSGNRGKGQCAAWLRARMDYSGDDCLIWPFSRDTDGYGQLGYLGKQFKAHRWMCEQVNGPAPEGRKCAAHQCGNGHLGCVNPRHLAWKSRLENSEDTIRHGRARKGGGYRLRKISREDAIELISLKGVKPLAEVSAMYGVHPRHISAIWNGRSRKAGSSSKTGGAKHRQFTDDEIRHIRTSGSTSTEVASEYGVNISTICKIRLHQTYVYVTPVAVERCAHTDDDRA